MPSSDDARPVDYIGGPVRRLFMRYPWHVSAVVGVLLITGLRPCTRHVPDAPPVVGAMPGFTLQGAGGEARSLGDLAGHVWIAGFVAVDAAGPDGEVGEALVALAAKSRTHDKPMRFLAIGSRADRDTPDALAAWATARGLERPRCEWLAGPQGDTDAIRAQLVSTFGAQTSEVWAHVFIIDDRGKLRGAYPLGERGVDEAYHRAQHVARDSRAAASTSAGNR